MSGSRVILLAVAFLVVAALLGLRSCGAEEGGVRPERESVEFDPAESGDPPPAPAPESPNGSAPAVESAAPTAPPEGDLQPGPGPVLLVVDAESGAPLANARAHRVSDSMYRGRVTVYSSGGVEIAHTLPGTVLGSIQGDPSGRIRLPFARGVRDLLVIAPDHAWVKVEVATALPGEVLVPLPPGGSLRLRILGFDELRSPVLMARLAGEGPLRLPRPASGGEVVVEGLIAASWWVRVREGSRGPVVGEGEVTILPGATADLVIEAVPTPDTRVRVTGSVFVPAGWEFMPQTLRFEDQEGRHLGSADLDLEDWPVAGANVLTLSARVEPGNYIVEVQPFQWRTQVTIPRNGAVLDLRLPEPARVRVRVLDATTGKPIPEAEVAWHASTKGVHRYMLDEAELDAETSSYRITTPPGTVGIYAEAEGYFCGDAYVEAVAGKTHEVEIRLEKAGVLIVKFVLEGEPFPAEGIEVNLQFKSRRGESWGGGEMRRGEGASVVFSDLEDGVVEVSAKLPAGFREVESKTVEVRQGETREVVFRLERE